VVVKDTADKSERVRAVVEQFIADRASGIEVSATDLLRVHADLSPELSEEFQRLGRLDQAMIVETAVGVLSIRCPQCGQPCDADCETPWTELSCLLCGAEFSLGAQRNERGDVIGHLAHFQILGRLGLGSFGTVWKAQDPQLDRTVAIKVPRQQHLSDVEAEQFFREARAAACLRHPNIVAVHEVGRANDDLYIVSDFIAGTSLDEWLEQRDPAIREIVVMMVTLARAIEHAHQAGVIHRDLKPRNIVVDAGNQPHILDFGMAKRLSTDATLTVDGQLMGTPAYMSPEQARGHANKSDHRTDIYSLGVILFYLLTKELPFRGDLQMMIRQVIEDEPPSPRKLNHRVPADLETICLKCLEKEPHKRLSSAEELAEELERYLQGRPIRTRRIGYAGRTLRWIRRNPLTTTFIVTLFLVVAVGASVSTFFAMRASNSATEATAMRFFSGRVGLVVVDQLKRELQAAETELESYRGYYDARLKSLADLATQDPTTVRTELDLYPEPYRHQQWHLLDRQLRDQSSLPARTPTPSRTASPSQQAVVTEMTKPVGASFAANSTLVALWDQQQAMLFDLDAQRLLTKTASPAMRLAVISPTETHWALTAGDHEHPHVAQLIRLDTGQVTHTLPHQDEIRTATFSPDGEILATATGDHLIHLWDVQTGKEIATKHAYRHDYVDSLSFTLDSQRLVSAGGRTLKQWNVTQRTAILVPIRLALSDDILSVHVSPTGQRALVVTPTESWMVVLPGATTRNLPPRRIDDSPTAVAFSADGRHLYASTRRNEISLWQLDSSKRLHHFPPLDVPVLAIGLVEERSELRVALADGSIRVLPLR
jgi:hypothetical protein